MLGKNGPQIPFCLPEERRVLTPSWELFRSHFPSSVLFRGPLNIFTDILCTKKCVLKGVNHLKTQPQL